MLCVLVLVSWPRTPYGSIQSPCRQDSNVRERMRWADRGQPQSFLPLGRLELALEEELRTMDSAESLNSGDSSLASNHRTGLCRHLLRLASRAPQPLLEMGLRPRASWVPLSDLSLSCVSRLERQNLGLWSA